MEAASSSFQAQFQELTRNVSAKAVGATGRVSRLMADGRQEVLYTRAADLCALESSVQALAPRQGNVCISIMRR